jgi:hypothetical protein
LELRPRHADFFAFCISCSGKAGGCDDGSQKYLTHVNPPNGCGPAMAVPADSRGFAEIAFNKFSCQNKNDAASWE